MLTHISRPHLKGEKIKWDGDTIKIYMSTVIRSTPSVSLTQGDMVLYALLCGRDYDSVSEPMKLKYLLDVI